MAPVIPLIAGFASVASTIAPLIAVAGTVLTASATANADNYKAQTLERQAARDSWNGQLQSQDQGLAVAQTIGDQTTAIGASGFSLNSTASQDRLNTLRILGRRDETRIVSNAQVQTDNSLADASMARSSGKAALLTGAFGLGTDLINSASFANRAKINSLNYTSNGVNNGL